MSRKAGQVKLYAKKCRRPQAKHFIRLHHRHHEPKVGDLWCMCVCDESGLARGVSVISRPVARGADDGWTVEVSRVATDGTPNACSALYGASARAAKALGYTKIITYTLEEESGSSMRAVGWRRQDRKSRAADGWRSRNGRKLLVSMGTEGAGRALSRRIRWELELRPTAPFDAPVWPEADDDQMSLF